MTISVLVLAAAMTAACAKPASPAVATNAAQRPIKIETVSKHVVGEPREQVADIASSLSMDIMPKVDGKVVEVLKQRGDTVQEGDVLFRVDSKDAQSQLAKNELNLNSSQEMLNKSKEDIENNRKDLQNSLAKSQEQLTNVTKDYNTARNQYDSGLIAKKDLDQSEQQYNNARMDVESIQNKLNALDSTNSLASQESQVNSSQLSVQDSNRTLDDYNVKAPASGVLSDFAIEQGMTVSRSAKAGTVQQVNTVKLKAELTDSAYQLVKDKKELTYYSADTPDQKAKAPVTFLSSVMNAQTKTYSLELEVANADQKLKPGSRVLLQLTNEADQMQVAVPMLSIVREGADAYVFVAKGDVVEKRKVKLGRVKETYQEVIEGLKEGESIVVSGQNQLKDGQKIEAAK
ncbi:efflux RND transporter periplasmic adaptor subunit [Paenibacillus cremeus]|uniref:Efflux RND transporter periplasmic adaptor subunit n=2 Tax=Paenibacillus cremeus TaxID=2163881 RepID=A0A559K6V4_9BACL|nr:efflux RND transporter periplasmic adaptor subunit [Paenibacillus cremeus]